MDGTPTDQRPAGRRVMLMATCLCDAFFPGAARAAVEVLEYAGCEVVFPPGQTCCGQPAFNGGDWATSRRVALHAAEVFAGDLPVVVPSGSCAAMHRHGNALQFARLPPEPAVEGLAARTWEACDFLVNGLGLTAWPGRLDGTLAVHHSCHTRGTATGQAMVTLLGSIEGVRLLEVCQSDQCCGFGGTFSVTFPHISAAMGNLKLDHALAGRPDFLVSADLSCLMHLAGLAGAQGRRAETRHVLEVLADALATAGARPGTQQTR
jgi:L-lactate dehydrogenase complex protein LldE